MPRPSVSVIVTAKNEQETVERCLAALMKQDYLDYEILFVDAGSEDDTLSIAHKMAAGDSRLRILQATGNPSHCRNMALRLSSSDIIAFTDADVEVPSTWLTQSVGTLLSSPSIGGVGGPNKPTRGHSTEFVKAVDLMLATSLGSMRSAQSYDFREKTVVKSIPCCNAIYRQSLITEMGGFDEELVGCDDTDLGYRISRAGLKLVFDPESEVLHYVKFSTIRQFARLMFKYGRGRGYASKRKKYLFSGPAIPAAGLAIVLPGLLLVCWLSWSLIPLEFVLAAYAFLIVGYSLTVAASQRNLGVAFVGPIVLTAEYISYFAGFLVGLFDRGPSRWSG
ncbi:glycosyltransferase [Candidatus Bathyarchaeota archaeon]|nr:MAG: glycosyltransferase [Candidatus Bathyarchaeota archaeon]